MLKTDELYYSRFLLKGDLENVVKYGWIMKSDELARSDHDLLIPDGCSELIFVLKGVYCKESIDGKTETIIIKKSCFVGIQSQSVFASRINKCHLLGLKLYPWGAYRLFGNKLKNAAAQNVFIEDFGFNWLKELNNQLDSTQKESRMIELIREAFCKQVNQGKENQELERAASYLKTILKKDGQVSVQELAEKHHLSIRHLQRKFKDYYGISPKKFINIIRFKQIYKSSVLQRKVPNNFLEFGYYDQMHFIKDFRKQLGITPSNTKNKAFLKQNEMAKLNS